MKHQEQTRFQLFDSVQLTQAVQLSGDFTNAVRLDVAPVGTLGAIVEMFNDGEAYMVELFGDWVKYDEQGNFISADSSEPQAFMETIGVETVYPCQFKVLEKW